MPVEAHRLVLREHQDLPQAAVEAVGQREIDDPIRPAERHGRLGAVARQRLQPRSFAAGQNDGQHVLKRRFAVLAEINQNTPHMRTIVRVPRAKDARQAAFGDSRREDSPAGSAF